MCMYVYVYVVMCGYVYVCLSVYVCVYVHVYVCICNVCMYVCVYACTYMYHVGMHATNVQETRSNMFSESCISILDSFLVDSQQQQQNPCSSTFSGVSIFFYHI